MALAGIPPDVPVEPDWADCGLRLTGIGAACVIITLGSQGCQIVAAKPFRPTPSPRVEAVDTVGAGDAFNGALAAALAEKRALRDAAAWACAAAALAVTRPGAQAALPLREAIDAFSRQ
jgi:ribokinase